MNTKIIKIYDDEIIFDNGYKLSSYHDQNCCEHHYLDFEHIDKDDYEKLKFDLSNDNFFTRIDGYGIQLNALNNFPLRIPGYGSNNGYYSSNLSLVLIDTDGNYKNYDVSDCQVISD